MKLKEEAAQIVLKTFGSEVAHQLDTFEDPNKYPVDFLDQCVYFLGKLVGEETSKKKFLPLYKKFAAQSSARSLPH
ncbi:MAG: hypothetical protein V1837_02595 [Candidatus Woesearchaeota archaeon]